MTAETNALIARLTTADFVCSNCGLKYGKYAAGRSPARAGFCQVCGDLKELQEVRDFGYLQPGIEALQKKETIKAQSKQVAEYLSTFEDNDDPASYDFGEIRLMLTSEEVGYLNQCLDVISDAGVDDEDSNVFAMLETKITELYADYCVDYSLSPVTAAYYKKYGTFGFSDEEKDRYEKFKENYDMLLELGFVTEGDNA